MPLDLKGLIRDRRFQVAAAGVAAVGGYALWQRKKTTGSTSAQPANANTTGTGSVGTFDSTGTDVAGWLGSQSGQFQGILDDFTTQLNGTLTSLRSGGPQPTPTPVPVPAAPIPRKPASAPVLVPVPNTTVTALLRLTPQIRVP